MDAGGIREIADMQRSIDQYDYFINHLYLRLKHPENDITFIDSGNKICQEIWKEIDKLQSTVKNYERKTSPSD